jgi:DNA repair exonuclease SbcCD ATPase subunit
MFQPVRIHFTNLLSHKDTVFNFTPNRTTLIYGKNIGVEGSDSNGAGKSTIIEAITIAFTGESYRDLSQEEFIKDNETTSTIDFLLNNDFDNSTFELKWIFTRGKSAKLEIYENGIHNKNITGVPEGKKYIFEKIGIGREDLLNYFIINQDNNHSFFSNTDTKQKEIVARFANYSSVELILDKLNIECKKTNLKRTDKQTEVTATTSVIESLEQQIQEQLEEQEVELVDSTKIFKDEITTNFEAINKLNEANHTHLSGIVTNNEEVKTLEKDLVKFTEDETKLKQLKKELSENDELIYKCKKEIKELDLKLSSTITCPKCEHEFLHDDDEDCDIEQIKTSKDEYEILLPELVQNSEVTKKKINDINKRLIDKTTIQNKISKCKNQVTNLTTNISTNNSQVRRLTQRNEQLQRKITEEKQNLNSTNNIKALEEKADFNKSRLKVLQQELEVIIKDQTENELMLYHFGRKGFMTFLANKTIKVIEQLVNDYLQKFATNLSVIIEGYTKLKNGDIREKIQIHVVKDGIKKGRFARYSGGQKMRVNLCGIFTFQKLINLSLPPEKGLNLLVLDEDLDGLDKLGNIFALKMLESSKKIVIAISHLNDDEFTGAYNKVYVQYEDGNSELINNLNNK